MSSSNTVTIKDSCDDKPAFTRVEGMNADGSARTFIAFNHVLYSDYGIKISVKKILTENTKTISLCSPFVEITKAVTDELDKQYGEKGRIGDVRFVDTIQTIIIDGIVDYLNSK